MITSLGYDKIYGDGGDDILSGSSTTQFISGGAGDDVIYSNPNGFITRVNGGSGTNEIHGGLNTWVTYGFSKEVDPAIDDNYLISAKDMGGYFEIVTSIGTDNLYGQRTINFSELDGEEIIYLYDGMDYHDGAFHGYWDGTI